MASTGIDDMAVRNKKEQKGTTKRIYFFFVGIMSSFIATSTCVKQQGRIILINVSSDTEKRSIKCRITNSLFTPVIQSATIKSSSTIVRITFCDERDITNHHTMDLSVSELVAQQQQRKEEEEVLNIDFHPSETTYATFSSRYECSNVIRSIVDRDTLRSACEKYGPFSQWDLTEIKPSYDDYTGVDLSGLFSDLTKGTYAVLSNVSTRSEDANVLNLSRWKLPKNLSDLSNMFAYSWLERIVLPQLSITQRTGGVVLNNMFNGCSSLREVNIDVIFYNDALPNDTEYRTYHVCSNRMFRNCYQLRTQHLSWPTPELGKMLFDCTAMFSGCVNLTEVTTNLLLWNVETSDTMFYKCLNLETVNSGQVCVSGSKVNMFVQCRSLSLQWFFHPFLIHNPIGLYLKGDVCMELAKNAHGLFTDCFPCPRRQDDDVVITLLLKSPNYFAHLISSPKTLVQSLFTLCQQGDVHEDVPRACTMPPWTIECKSYDETVLYTIVDGCLRTITNTSPVLVSFSK